MGQRSNWTCCHQIRPLTFWTMRKWRTNWLLQQHSCGSLTTMETVSSKLSISICFWTVQLYIWLRRSGAVCLYKPCISMEIQQFFPYLSPSLTSLTSISSYFFLHPPFPPQTSYCTPRIILSFINPRHTNCMPSTLHTGYVTHAPLTNTTRTVVACDRLLIVCWGIILVPDPNQPQHGLLSVLHPRVILEAICMTDEVWGRD